MPNREQVKVELKKLVDDGLGLVKSLVKEEEGKAGFRFSYQEWYTRALGAVGGLAPDRLDEFRRYYEPDPKRKSLGYGDYVIQDYFKGVAPSAFQYPDFDTCDQAARGVINQVAILKSLNGRIDDVLGGIETRLLADMQDAELATATKLVNVSARAAGALAGVVLEQHLQLVVKAHQCKIAKRNPTIADFNDGLKQASVYATATWRKISYLGDLRNLCSHKKASDPTTEQASELIDGVNWAVKNVA